MNSDIPRRKFLAAGIVILNALIASLLAIPGVGYLLSPLIRRGASRWAKLGPIEDFDEALPQRIKYRYRQDSEFVERDRIAIAIVVRENDKWVVMSTTCTHLGCNVAYNPEDDSFDCPCHGGRYDRSGNVISGPPPEPLRRFATREIDGTLEIEVSE